MKPCRSLFPVSFVRRAAFAASVLLASGTALALPDLVVTAVDVSGLAQDCHEATVSGSLAVTLRNAGTEFTQVATKLLAFDDVDLDDLYSPVADTALAEAVVPPLAAGADVVIVVPLSGTLRFAGAPISLFADSRDIVREISEANVVSSGDFLELPPSSTDYTLNEKYTVSDDPNGVGATAAWVAQVTDDDGTGVVDARDDVDILWMPWVNNQWSGTTLQLVDGRTGDQHAESSTSYFVTTIGAPAIGDLDGDGLPEIVAVAWDMQHLYAFNNDLTWKWTSESHAIQGRVDDGGGVLLENLDGVGPIEILIGATVFSSTGRFLADGAAGHSDRFIGLNTSTTPIGVRNTVADVDGDGLPEILGGGSSYSYRAGRLSLDWTREDVGEGFTAVGNVDGDAGGTPEIVVVKQGYGEVGHLLVLNADGTDPSWWNPPNGGYIELPGYFGGPPTLADFDGDGDLGIAVATTTRITVYEPDGSEAWHSGISDPSGMTTPSAFDFDGDGLPEILVRDEHALTIFDGVTGAVLGGESVWSGTGLEQPTVADIDGDGHAEILTVQAYVGLRVFGNDTWAAARACWNESDYHVTNIDDSGTRIPRREVPRWLAAPPGDFHRQIWPGPVPFPAPDLTASLVQIIDGPCDGEVTLTTRVGSCGGVSAPSGVHVALYAGDPGDGNDLGAPVTTEPLFPGEHEDVSLVVAWDQVIGEIWAVADDDGSGDGTLVEGN